MRPFHGINRSKRGNPQVRALFSEPTTENGDEEPLGESGFPVPINVDALVERIYVAPTSKDWEFEAVQSLATKYQLRCEVKRSGLDDPALF